jgi:hypothetical protein
MILALLYIVCGIIASIIAVKAELVDEENEWNGYDPPLIVVLFFWPFFLFIGALFGSFMIIEWGIRKICKYIPDIRIGGKDGR